MISAASSVDWPLAGAAGMTGSRPLAEIDQATAMLTGQLGVGIAQAFIRLRACAYTCGRRVSGLARDIVARRLRLCSGLGPCWDGQA